MLNALGSLSQRFGLWHYAFLGVAGIVGMASLGTLVEYWEYPFLGEASLSWPSVEGEITHSFVSTRDTTMPDDDFRYSTHRTHTTHTTSANIEYTYVIGGEKFVSSLVSFAPFGQKARRTVDKYPEGSRVRVYYDPGDPKTAVLETGTPTSTLALVGGAGGFVVLVILISTIYVIVVSLEDRRLNRQNPVVCEALEEAGFKLKEWTRDKFGSSLTADELSPYETDTGMMTFSLTKPPYGSFEDGRYCEDIPPQGVAMTEYDHHLVEINNDGRRSYKRGRLLRIVVELPWTWFSDREELKRPITLWDLDNRKANTLQHICLAMRTDAEWWAENWKKKPWGLVGSDDEMLPVANFTTGDETFDSFFTQKVGCEQVRRALQRFGELGEVVEPLKRWQEVLYEVQVTTLVEVWVDLKKMGWDELAGKLPLLAEDVALFTMRLEQAFGV